jgi:uncharacterized protein with PQ loop repeat
MLWINNFGNFCNTFNGVLDQWNDMVCCQQLSPWQCTEALLVLIQLAINWLLVFLIWVLALMFFEHDGTFASSRTRLWAWLGFFIFGVIVAVGWGIAMIFGLMLGGDSDEVKGYAYSLGIISAIVPIFTWTPQIWATYKLKSPGSLSITMQIIQVPGSFILAFYQVINGQWLVGMTAVVAGIEQTILLVLCLIYWFREWRERRKNKSEVQSLLNGEENDGDLSDPLLVPPIGAPVGGSAGSPRSIRAANTKDGRNATQPLLSSESGARVQEFSVGVNPSAGSYEGPSKSWGSYTDFSNATKRPNSLYAYDNLEMDEHTGN